jgi:low affinity Fe/Cu permease
VQQFFRVFAQRVSEATGSPWAFLAALAGVIAWLVLGPFVGFSESWLISMGTICSVIPSLMVFLIQNMQNRDSKVMQLKLDELIRSTSQARNTLIHLESMSDAELAALESEFVRVRGNREPQQAEVQLADTTRSTSPP